MNVGRYRFIKEVKNLEHLNAKFCVLLVAKKKQQGVRSEDMDMILQQLMWYDSFHYAHGKELASIVKVTLMEN